MGGDPVIYLLSLAWSLVNGIRRSLYQLGAFGSVRFPVRTISVGNIEAGGTGKTPVVIELVRRAEGLGRTPVVLTRGHGGEWSRMGGVIEPGSSSCDPALCGDEAALVQSRAGDAWIGVGADRVASFERVNARASQLGLRAPDCVILDDGYQHLRIARDLDLVLVTDSSPARRLFREWPSSLTAKPAVPRVLIRVRKKIAAPLSSEAAERLWLVSGIGNPASFEASVREAGWHVARRTDFPDHARYSLDWIRSTLAEAAKQQLKVAVTGKDWVKWSSLGIPPDAVRVFEPLLECAPDPSIELLFGRPPSGGTAR